MVPPQRFMVCSISTMRVRGDFGLPDLIDSATWLALKKPAGPGQARTWVPANAAAPAPSEPMIWDSSWARISSPGEQCTRMAI